MNFRCELRINKPRLLVWRAFDNPENLAHWQPNLLSFKQVSGETGQMGATSTLIYDENGHHVQLTETILLRQQPELFSAHYESSFAVSHLDNHFIEMNDSHTQWLLNAAFQFKGLWRIFSFFLSRSIRARTKNDMLRFKQLLEADKFAR